MGQISISVASTVTLDGVAHASTGTMIIPCDAYTQQTRDFTDGFEEVVGDRAVYAAIVVINLGTESLFLQMSASGGTAFLVFEIVAGGHGVYPASVGNGTPLSVEAVSLRSETSAGCRAVIITVQNN